MIERIYLRSFDVRVVLQIEIRIEFAIWISSRFPSGGYVMTDWIGALVFQDGVFCQVIFKIKLRLDRAIYLIDHSQRFGIEEAIYGGPNIQRESRNRARLLASIEDVM